MGDTRATGVIGTHTPATATSDLSLPAFTRADMAIGTVVAGGGTAIGGTVGGATAERSVYKVCAAPGDGAAHFFGSDLAAEFALDARGPPPPGRVMPDIPDPRRNSMSF